jgi:hypothetical protein
MIPINEYLPSVYALFFASANASNSACSLARFSANARSRACLRSNLRVRRIHSAVLSSVSLSASPNPFPFNF